MAHFLAVILLLATSVLAVYTGYLYYTATPLTEVWLYMLIIAAVLLVILVFSRKRKRGGETPLLHA